MIVYCTELLQPDTAYENEREWEAVNKAVNKGAPAVSKHHGSEMFR